MNTRDHTNTRERAQDAQRPHHPTNTGGAGHTVHREVPAAVTLERIRPLFPHLGITRVADITGLDRIGIPVYNAVVPRSRDAISIYSGKGVTAEDSKTSAVMEAVERFAAARVLPHETVASYTALRHGRPQNGGTTHDTVLHPADLLEPHPDYHDDLPLRWVRGHDIAADRPVLVPHCLVSTLVEPDQTRSVRLSTANGLASGNTHTEAVYHALTELVERDALTFAELLCVRLPYVLAHHVGATPGLLGALRDRCPAIHLDTLPARARALVDRFDQAGVALRLFSLTSPTGLPSVLAVAAEDNGPTTSKAHAGMGTSADLEVALTRAITECAQSRAVDVQAAREDFTMPDADVPKHQLFAKRVSAVDHSSWPWHTNGRQVHAGDLPTHAAESVEDLVAVVVDRLRTVGIDRVVVVDVSPPQVPAHVVRVLAPGLESWAVDRSRLGPRATAAWNSAVAQLGDRT